MANDEKALKTDRFELRMLKPSDAAVITSLMQNWNVLRMLSAPPHPYTLEDAENFISARLNQGNTPQDCTYAISIADTLVGVIDIARNAKGEPTLGYWLDETHWGQGIMSDAVALLVNAYFGTQSHATLYSSAYEENPASIRVQEKVGFRQAGKIEIFSSCRNQMIKGIATRLTRDEFERQRL